VAFDADRSVFLSSNEFGNTVVVGATTSTGVFRTRDVEEGEYGTRTRALVLQVMRGTFSTPARDATVTVGGTAYKFRGLVNQSPDTGNSSGFDYWIVSP
jgi:hypothetical protein